jgi:hypothetical protein
MDRREFRLMQLAGSFVFCVGALAANVGSITGAAVSLGVGTVTFVSGTFDYFLCCESPHPGGHIHAGSGRPEGLNRLCLG